MVCLFLDQVGESWTEAGYCPTSSSCPAGPIKTSRPSGPAAAATSFHMAASVDRTLPGPAGRLNGLPLAVPLSVFTLVLDWILSWRLSGCPVSRPPGCPHTAWSRRVPSGALGDQKGSWKPIPGEATISPSLWLTLASGPSPGSGCGSGQVALGTRAGTGCLETFPRVHLGKTFYLLRSFFVCLL